jgi:Zn-dependent protease with chaperone function
MDEEQAAWSAVQYRGDRRALDELYKSYNVENYIRMWEEKQSRSEHSARRQIAKDSVLLTSTLSPRVYGLVEKIKQTLEMKSDFDVFCIANNDINAYARIDRNAEGSFPFIVLTSRALEELSDDEITFLIGHELGHILFRHNRLLHLLDRSKEEHKGRETVLPYLGENVFLGWRKKSEISADRIGYLCAGSFEPCARALLKTGVGLSEKNLNLDIQHLLGQIEEIRHKPEILDTDFRTHPLLPIRLKSLELFAEQRASDDQMAGVERAAHDDMEDRIDEIFSWLERFPRKESERAAMYILASAGKKMLSRGGTMQPAQVEELYLTLHRSFLDEPELVLTLDEETLADEERKGYDRLRELREESWNTFIISRLADIALARGGIKEEETVVIAETAKGLGESRETALGILISAANTVGFRTDVKLNRIVEAISTSFYEVRSGTVEQVVKGLDV